MADTRFDLGVIGLDRLTSAAPIAALAARQVDDQVLLGQGKARGDALDGDAERRPV